MTDAISVDSIRLGDASWWSAEPDIDAAFRTLRAERPVSWHEEDYQGMMPNGPGFWSVVRYDDVMAVSRDPETFVSSKGTNIPDFPPEVAEFFGSMINMDAPRHTKLRLIVNRGFTPRMVARIEESVRDRAQSIVADVAGKGECDFVNEVAAALPLQIICDMMGIASSDYSRIFDLTNVVLGASDPEYGGDISHAFAAAAELSQFAVELGRERLANPTDDITSTMMHAEVDGERLTDIEFGSFFILLVVAGNETTRNAISHGMLALTDHPDQREKWLANFDAITPTAVEEIVRWATPVIHFRRTATRDAVVGGQEIKAGDKVALWYSSANRDERQFPDPYRFDVTRTPNEHLGFGGGGPHFCLGAHLARREIRMMFEELFRVLPDIEVSGPPAMLASNFIHGIKRMPVKFTPVAG